MITLKQYWMGRQVKYPPSDQLKANALRTVTRTNELLTIYNPNLYFYVRSGYRPPAINKITPNASKNSRHMTCEAIDVADSSGEFKAWCLQNLDKLELCQLWMEDPEYTP